MCTLHIRHYRPNFSMERFHWKLACREPTESFNSKRLKSKLQFQVKLTQTVFALCECLHSTPDGSVELVTHFQSTAICPQCSHLTIQTSQCKSPDCHNRSRALDQLQLETLEILGTLVSLTAWTKSLEILNQVLNFPDFNRPRIC